MAVIDQDNFSNISWNSEPNGPAGSSSSGGYDGHDEEGANSKSPPPQPPLPQSEGLDADDIQRLDPGLGGEILDCTVTDAHTENLGTKDAYVSYLITTNVGKDLFQPPPPWTT